MCLTHLRGGGGGGVCMGVVRILYQVPEGRCDKRSWSHSIQLKLAMNMSKCSVFFLCVSFSTVCVAYAPDMLWLCCRAAAVAPTHSWC